MKQDVLIFEQSHIDGFGKLRTDVYIPVEDYTVGDMLINETVKKQFADEKKYQVKRFPENHTVIVCLKDKYKGQIPSFDNCVLAVKCITPVDIETLTKQIEVQNKTKIENDFDFRFVSDSR